MLILGPFEYKHSYKQDESLPYLLIVAQMNTFDGNILTLQHLNGLKQRHACNTNQRN